MLEGIWQEFLAIVKEEVGSAVVETWLKAVVPKQWDALKKTMYVRAPNKFVRDWINAHYLNLFHVHLGRLFNVDALSVSFVDVETVPTIAPTPVRVIPAIPGASNSRSTAVRVAPRGGNRGFNSAHRFDNFVVGTNNSLAYAAACAVAENPGNIYNPLFIYGQSGLGKTHLLHAIGNAIKERERSYVVLYQTADRFVNEFINAIRFDKVHLFREKYKDVDVLLVDDIQFISNKGQTQEAFFHTFNALYDVHKQIVFSSDTYPRDITGIVERLRSRLEWGLVVDIHEPPLETKIAILRRKAEQNNEHLSDDVLDFIATTVGANIRDLEGALIRVLAFASLTGQPLSLELAQKVLIRSSQATTTQGVSMEAVARCVSKCYSTSIAELRSPGRNKDLVIARQVAMYLMKNMTYKSLSDIGLFFKRKDHSTVAHAVSKIDQMRAKDELLHMQLKQLEKEIVS